MLSPDIYVPYHKQNQSPIFYSKRVIFSLRLDPSGMTTDVHDFAAVTDPKIMQIHHPSDHVAQYWDLTKV